ncbi:MAG: alpha/beta hydrolase [bacterium]|nr:alpha/beta hydrolase [bacterium]
MVESLIFIKERIATIIHKPEIEPKGLVILCAGYLDSKDYEHLSGLAKDLSKVGYIVVRFDSTGIWDSKGTIDQYTIPQQLEDIQDIIDYMFKEKTYNNVIIGGHSLGGFVALLYAASHPIITKTFAIMSPYALSRNINIKKTLRLENSGIRVSLRDVPGKNDKREFHVPFSNFEDASQYNLLNEVPKLKIPILFIAGEMDDVIPATKVELIFKNSNEPKKILVMKGMDHDYRHNLEQINLVNKEVINFLDSTNL